MTGRFYIGFGQASGGQFLPYGYDLNNVSTAPTLFYNTQDTWTKPVLTTPGTILMRAVMNNNVVVTSTRAAASAAVQPRAQPRPGRHGGGCERTGFPARRRARRAGPPRMAAARRRGWPGYPAPARRRCPAACTWCSLTPADGSVATRRLAVE
ncbi:MAG: hypothetical protein WKG07_32480 [Hymenobacter sp.]